MTRYLAQMLAEAAFWRSAYIHNPTATYLNLAKRCLKRARLANLSLRKEL